MDKCSHLLILALKSRKIHALDKDRFPSFSGVVAVTKLRDILLPWLTSVVSLHAVCSETPQPFTWPKGKDQTSFVVVTTVEAI